MPDETRIGAYCNDHRAGAHAVLDVLGRLAGDDDMPAPDTLRRLEKEVRAELDTLEEVMARLEIARDPLRAAAGWTAEKASRLRTSAVVTRDRALSRLLEVEVVLVGVRGKQALWEALQDVVGDDPRLEGIDLPGLADQAVAQLETVDDLRREVARAALLT